MSVYGGRHKTRANYRKAQNTKLSDTKGEVAFKDFALGIGFTYGPASPIIVVKDGQRFTVRPDGFGYFAGQNAFYIEVDGYFAHRKGKRKHANDLWVDEQVHKKTGFQTIHVGDSYLLTRSGKDALVLEFAHAATWLDKHPEVDSVYITEEYA